MQIGQTAPDFQLTDSSDRPWRLSEHLPLALFFFRGTW